MYEVDCPYCGEEVEINHDDGYGYEEDRIHKQRCRYCGHTFGYATFITIHHEAHKAPCLSGGEHELQKVAHSPRYWPDWVRCKNCDYEYRGKREESV